MNGYYDYRFRFPVAGIAQALTGFAALRQVGLLPAEGLPANMLGEPLDATGAPTDAEDAAFVGRRSGDHFHVHIRSRVDPATLPVSPATFGLEPVTEADSAAVLGVWA